VLEVIGGSGVDASGGREVGRWPAVARSKTVLLALLFCWASLRERVCEGELLFLF